MKKLADDLYVLDGLPPNAINIYLMGDALVDSGTRGAWRRIVRELNAAKVQPEVHVATHAHIDHVGSSARVCDTLGMPLYCGRGDVEAVESDDPAAYMPVNWIARATTRAFSGPPHLVAAALEEGDEIGGFTVLETPGHTPGHISFWRESDRTLVLGDVLFARPFPPGMTEPPAFWSADPARNRDSARRIAALEPTLVCFGHGPPLRDTRKVIEYVAGLAD